MFSAVLMFSGCQKTNNNLEITTGLGKYLSGGSTAVAPLSAQQITGSWDSDMPVGDPNNTVDLAPFGDVYNFNVVTNPNYIVDDARMPAYWDFSWYVSGQTCYSPNYPYAQLTSPQYYPEQVVLPTVYYWPLQQLWNGVVGGTPNPKEPFVCWTNTPNNPDFVSSDVSPQFALDNALPASIQVHAFQPISAAASDTQLNVYNMAFANPATLTAESVASDGSSATFPYPKGLSAGAYITTITTGTGTSATTNGFEPFYLAHNDTTWETAFGVDVAIPTETVQTLQWIGDQNGPCAGGATVSTTKYGGSTLPLVTLVSQGKLAVGSSSNTIEVGKTPTVVIAYNSTAQTVQQNGPCGPTYVANYSGAQSALVVNTGSNSISLVNIGEYSYPSGTISVGNSPVAAVINPAGTMAYIANYGSGTISEINLANVQVTRTLSVSPYPTAISFDSSGNLWVGGQGFLDEVSVSNWNVQTSYGVDGTITGMQYDAAQGGFVAEVLKNGSATQPVSGITKNAEVAFSKTTNTSYSTTSLLNTATGVAIGSSATGDNAPYTSSSIASLLAFPGQTAFQPPIYTSSAGDYVAAANGNSFTVSILSSGKVLLSGSTPYPIRGVKLTSTNLYLTMPESNSLVTLPIQLP